MQQPSEITQNTNNADVPQAVEHKVVSGDFSVLLENVVSNSGIFVLLLFPRNISRYDKAIQKVKIMR